MSAVNDIINLVYADGLSRPSERDLLAIGGAITCGVAGKVTPPCITPTAPLVTPKVIGNTHIFITWSQPANTGSFITGYTVKWGTTSGVYTNSATVPVIPRTFDITGLSTGTQYFFVVQANTLIAGCSATSSERNATTSGAPPSNQLLQGLISYWKFDVNVSPYADSVGGNPLTGTTTSAGVVAGILNGGLDISIGSSHADHVDNTDFSPAANTSLSFSLWISASNWTGGTGFPLMLLKGDNAVLNSYGLIVATVNSGNNDQLDVFFEDTSSTQFGVLLTAGAPTPNVYHHVVMVFDAPNKQVRGYYDGVLIGTKATNTSSILTGAQVFAVGVRAGGASYPNLKMDEMAMWHKALVQADVTNIFNGGACLPLSGYQN